ncbi:hypothetical protein ACJX0J_021082, partial [Zea mays]
KEMGVLENKLEESFFNFLDKGEALSKSAARTKRSGDRGNPVDPFITEPLMGGLGTLIWTLTIQGI